MEGQASDYRQTDSHIIAAMGKEAYEIPPASAIPGLMQEYFDFLASTEIRPLLKAAVGQAYLLIGSSENGEHTYTTGLNFTSRSSISMFVSAS